MLISPGYATTLCRRVDPACGEVEFVHTEQRDAVTTPARLLLRRVAGPR